MFKKVLIANRGEIAVRIAQTLQEMSIAVVAVFSDVDRDSPHVSRADEAYHLDGIAPSETYLDAHKIVEAAKHHKVDAIHPGYGFLSENAAFAHLCADEGITFIGPSPKVISAMGDKIVAKQTLETAGVPLVPGWSSDDANLSDIRKAADRIGYPVLLKAAAGGGGKGMRIVEAASDIEGALGAAQREANSAFGDARVFVEKYIARPRHIEFQIFGDHHGNVVHLFERECSIQRRYQKIIEETPAPNFPDSLRQKMGESAVAAAKAINYTGAGTVEFLVDEHGHFYFLEVNTRLQVEHPITEAVVDQDLVRTQVLVAAGEPLPFTQDQLRQTGHALEARIYAEDPARGFLPSTGLIDRYHQPHGRWIRVDSGVRSGSLVTVHYDPMLAKLITWGDSRDESICRMQWALQRYVVLGVTTNIEFLARVIDHPNFANGDLHTHFLDDNDLSASKSGNVPDEAFIIAALTMKRRAASRSRTSGDDESRPVYSDTPWQSSGRWRNT